MVRRALRRLHTVLVGHAIGTHHGSRTCADVAEVAPLCPVRPEALCAGRAYRCRSRLRYVPAASAVERADGPEAGRRTLRRPARDPDGAATGSNPVPVNSGVAPGGRDPRRWP